MGFPSQECWSGLSFPSPGDLSDPGTEPMSLTSSALQADFLPLSYLKGLRKLWKIVKDREAWRVVVHGVTRIGHNLVTEQQQQQMSYIK